MARRYYRRRSRRVPVNSISFETRPADAVLAILRSWGFRWNPRDKSWSAPQSVASATVIDSLRAGETDAEQIAVYVAERQAEADCGII